MTLEYPLTLDEKELILIQLRILKPTLSWKALETLYYVWKYPENYTKKIVEAKLYKNESSTKTVLQSLCDQNLLVTIFAENANNPRIRTLKTLDPELNKRIYKQSLTITLKLTLNA